MHKIAKKLSVALATMNPLALVWMSIASRDLEMKGMQAGMTAIQHNTVAEASLDVLHEFLKDYPCF